MEQMLAIGVSVAQARCCGAPVPGMLGGTPPFRAPEGCREGTSQIVILRTGAPPPSRSGFKDGQFL